MNKPQVIFFQVATSSVKLHKLAETALSHFQNKEKLFFLVSDSTSLEFIDTLLWKLPEESFLPHSRSSGKEYIQIGQDLPASEPGSLFNLTASPLLSHLSIKNIYEFEDLTSLEKKSLSQKRYEAYRQAGYPISLSV